MKYLLSAFLLFPFTFAHAQFFLNGNAVQLNDTCFRLTQPINNVVGSIWNPEKISLDESFDVVMRIFLGCQDQNGADGIVFGFQPVSTSIGNVGGGIGFQGITPSLGIEFDTYQNTSLSDPTFDHIAIYQNGDVNHFSPNALTGPIQASATSPNIEDCMDHDLQVSWDAAAKILRVYFDCSLRLIYTGDIVNEIFGGDPLVFWGFTSATGGLNNIHQVCFRYTTFIDQLEDVVICPGGQYQLNARGGTEYTWSPPDGLSDPNIPNPIASPTETTIYTVDIQDGCGFSFQDDILVTVAGDSVFFDLGPDTTICAETPLLLDVESGAATYQWSTGATSPTLLVDDSGSYQVTVTRTDTICVASDWVDIEVIQSPTVQLRNDTTLCEGQEIRLVPIVENAEIFQWQDGSSADTIFVNNPGFFEVFVANQCGEDRDEVNIDYENCRMVYIPSAFSPNFDGINDRFQLYADGDVERVEIMRIFDRWGGLTFEAGPFDIRDPFHGWDGTVSGTENPQGIYLYYLELTYRDGVRETFSGEVTLLR